MAVLLIALGVFAGLLLYGMSVVILFVFGFSFYAVSAGAILAFLLCLIGAPISYFRLRTRGPQFTERLVFFLAGMLLYLAALILEVMTETRHAIFPWTNG
jgi:hypothetical protein